MRDFHAFLEVRERTEVAALKDPAAIATRTRRSALEKYPADDASTKHVAIERVARRRGGFRRDATYDADLRRLPPTTSSLCRGVNLGLFTRIVLETARSIRFPHTDL